MSPRKRPATDQCPHCGATFRADRLACPECGSDARTGWQSAEDIDYTSVEIPDTWEELTRDAEPRGPGWLWIAAVIALVGFVVAILFGRF